MTKRQSLGGKLGKLREHGFLNKVVMYITSGRMPRGPNQINDNYATSCGILLNPIFGESNLYIFTSCSNQSETMLSEIGCLVKRTLTDVRVNDARFFL